MVLGPRDVVVEYVRELGRVVRVEEGGRLAELRDDGEPDVRTSFRTLPSSPAEAAADEPSVARPTVREATNQLHRIPDKVNDRLAMR